MSSFQDCFWSNDYLYGIQTIFAKLYQGCHENTEILNMIVDRINLESSYGKGLSDFPAKHSPHKQGFNKDEGATLRQAYITYLHDIQDQGNLHISLALELDRNVRSPFHAWSQHHESQIKGCEELVVERIKDYIKKSNNLKKLQQQYFAKSRQLEIEPSSKRSEVGDNGLSDSSSPERTSRFSRNFAAYNPFKGTSLPGIVGSGSVGATEVVDNTETDVSIEIDNVTYTYQALNKLIQDAMNEIALRPYKIPILGTYQNTSTGDEFIRWARKRLSYTSLGKAEKFGQALVDLGYLKPIGKVSSKFSAGNGVYQWIRTTNKAAIGTMTSPNFEIKPALTLTSSFSPSSSSASSFSADSHLSLTLSESSKSSNNEPGAELDEEQPNGTFVPTPISELADIVGGFLTSKEPDKLQNEVLLLEKHYADQVLQLDKQRCELEEIISDTLSTIESCELNRLRQSKEVLYRFSQLIGTPLERDFEKLQLNNNSINPDSDLRYTIENYKVNLFAPKVTIYKDFADSTKVIQSFGVDIATVPFMVPLFLNYINSQDPPVPVSAWLNQSSLPAIHKVRAEINNGHEFDANEVFAKFPISVILSTFKEFLLELPDPLISFTIYDMIKGIYSQHYDSDDNGEKKRQLLITALTHLPKQSLATLDLIVQYFVKKCEGDDQSSTTLASALSSYLFRPRLVSKTTMHDKHPTLFVKDLLSKYQDILQEVADKQLTRTRTRAVSSSDVTKRAVVEARNRRELLSSGSSTPINVNVNGRGPSPPQIGLRPLTLSPLQQVNVDKSHGTSGIGGNRNRYSTKHKKSTSMPMARNAHISPSLIITRESRDSRPHDSPLKIKKISGNSECQEKLLGPSLPDAESIIDGYASSEPELERNPNRNFSVSQRSLEKPLPEKPQQPKIETSTTSSDIQTTDKENVSADEENVS